MVAGFTARPFMCLKNERKSSEDLAFSYLASLVFARVFHRSYLVKQHSLWIPSEYDDLST